MPSYTVSPSPILNSTLSYLSTLMLISSRISTAFLVITASMLPCFSVPPALSCSVIASTVTAMPTMKVSIK